MLQPTHSSRRVNAVASRLGGRRYLEIGVHTGATFRTVEMEDRTGVDPSFAFDTGEHQNETTRLLEQTSDAFFAQEPASSQFDVVFIDGLHTFEQVVRDFSNTVLHTHRRSAILLDDTVPNDVYSALTDMAATMRFREAAGIVDGSWHGDVFKALFYIHDFWPGLNYRTIVGPGNPQTLIWRSSAWLRTPLYNNLEAISRLTFFDLQNNNGVLRLAGEEEAIALCTQETDVG